MRYTTIDDWPMQEMCVYDSYRDVTRFRYDVLIGDVQLTQEGMAFGKSVLTPELARLRFETMALERGLDITKATALDSV